MKELKIRSFKKEDIEDFVKAVCGESLISVDIQVQSGLQFLKYVNVYLKGETTKVSITFDFEKGITYSFDVFRSFDENDCSTEEVKQAVEHISEINYFMLQLADNGNE
jgi:hypothetical protein